MAEKSKEKAKTKKTKKEKVQKGMAMIQATFNNTLITLTDEEGNVLVQSSPAIVGFSGARRSTAFAATNAAQDAAHKAITRYGLREVKVFIKGPGAGRNAAVKGLDSAGLRITQLADRTPLPHNGCTPRKAPRN